MTEERAFLTAILEQPDDDVRKRAYADWLEERGDPRAEFLRLMLQVRQERVVTPEHRRQHQQLSTELTDLRTQEQPSPSETRSRERRMRELEARLVDLARQIRPKIPARLQELAASFETDWLAVVSDPEIELCGGAEVSWRLRFEFVCDKTWADLDATDDHQVRHCATCLQHVHFCESLDQARDHAREGHCVAVTLGVNRRKGDLGPPMTMSLISR